MPLNPPIADGFQQVVEKFSLRLTKKELEDFKFSTLYDLRTALNTIQEEQGKKRKMMNLTRIEAFLEAMEQYGKVVEVFLNASEILCFVWGPMKFLLQIASNWAESFDTLLDAYQQLAQNLPLLEQYKALFEDSPHMSNILAMMYEDILEFHQRALRFFAKPTWRQLFRATWKDFKARFQHILDDLRSHKELVETQANILQIQESRAFRTQCEISFATIQDDERKNQRLAVTSWLFAADVYLDQEASTSVRRNYPQTCRWILDKQEVKAWLDPDNTLVPIIWLNGIPGAGKTTLTSLVIEESTKVPSISLAFFYCKHMDVQRNTFLAIARSILLQLLNQNDELLPYLFDQCLSSGQTSLVSPKLCSELLQTALTTVSQTYIIVDGIDECAMAERKAIISFFTSIIENDAIPGHLRGLFISQDENDIKKLLRNASVLRLKESDNGADIKRYASHWALKIQDKFDLSAQEHSYIVSAVCERAEGMFLFAKLVLTNLESQTTKDKLYAELQPETFPNGFEKAYGRIVARILGEDRAEAEREDARKLLGWVIGAKRPLKWHEIQGAVSIDVDNQAVNFEDRRLRVHVKDLCGSLIEVLPGDRVTLVHRTAEIHLVEGNHVQLVIEEYKLAILCLRYLTFECFDHDLNEEKIRNFLIKGYYGFQDYASLHWVDHLESSIQALYRDDLPPIEDFSSAIEDFYTAYGAGTAKQEDVEKELKDKCNTLNNTEYLEHLVLLITNARKVRKADEEFSALGDLGQILTRIRSSLEDLSKSQNLGAATKDQLELFYGKYWHKCPRHLCFYFHEGFLNAAQRNQHIDRHERPFCCTEAGCPRRLIGFSSDRELKKHMNVNHPDPSTFAWKFPKAKKQSSKHTCEICGREYTRANSLRIHLRVHNNERPFKCRNCSKAFVRKHDCERHERLHTEQGHVVGSNTPSSSLASP